MTRDRIAEGGQGVGTKVFTMQFGGCLRLNIWIVIGRSKISMGTDENIKISTSASYMMNEFRKDSVQISLGCIFSPAHWRWTYCLVQSGQDVRCVL